MWIRAFFRHLWNRLSRPKETHFHPNQMVYLIWAPDKIKDEELSAGYIKSTRLKGTGGIKKLIDWSKNQVRKPELIGENIEITVRRVIGFPGVEYPKPEFEVVPYQAPQDAQEKDTDSVRERPHVGDDLYPLRPYGIIFVDVDTKGDSEKLQKLINGLDEAKKDFNKDGNIDFRIDAVTPHWLMPSARPAVTGGPGGRPKPLKFGDNDLEPRHKFVLQDKIQDLCENEGEGVNVVILDTAPSAHVLMQARKRVLDENPTTSRNLLLARLLGPHSPLQVYHAAPDALRRLEDFTIDDHHYVMSDHGLFVAGIIHSIAPRAKLHLFEVLNRYGVGDVETVIDALKFASENLTCKPLVVNMSLFLGLPLEYRRNLRQALTLVKICNQLLAQGSLIFTAAGNDGIGKDPPTARYPAAFESALGVGALPRRPQADAIALTLEKVPKLATYSNKPDEPRKVGISTLGGEPGETKGILGLYLGAFPGLLSKLRWKLGRQKNHNWAWWSGTSFATPIVSGVMAAVLSGHSGITTLQALQKFDASNPDIPGAAVESEDVLDVRQPAP